MSDGQGESLQTQINLLVQSKYDQLMNEYRQQTVKNSYHHKLKQLLIINFHLLVPSFFKKASIISQVMREKIGLKNY